jgi:hypothetical protein
MKITYTKQKGARIKYSFKRPFSININGYWWNCELLRWEKDGDVNFVKYEYASNYYSSTGVKHKYSLKSVKRFLIKYKAPKGISINISTMWINHDMKIIIKKDLVGSKLRKRKLLKINENRR